MYKKCSLESSEMAVIYIEDARCLKVNAAFDSTKVTELGRHTVQPCVSLESKA